MNNKSNNNSRPQFFILPYQYNRKCWSQKLQKYFYSRDIKDQIWETSSETIKGQTYDLHDFIKTIDTNKSKSERDALMRFCDVDRFPVKEQVDFSKWNGTIFIDLDLDKSSIKDKDVSFHATFYNALLDNLLLCDNFYYIEHSSSKVGLHLIFYYDIEKTEESFFKCAKYTRDYIYSLDSNIKGIAKLLNEENVFDQIYTRAWQKCFITGIDGYINDCSGAVDEELLSIEIKKKEVDTSHYELTNIDINGEWEVHYPERLKIYTAIKRVTSSEEECQSVWAELCKHFVLYKNNTYKDFVNGFRYDGIDETTAHIDILDKYGICIEKGVVHYHLKENEYLGDIRDKIIKALPNGITFLQAGTGVGKTRCWTDMNDKIINDVLELPYHKPILIVEPLNSIINTKYNADVKIVNGSKQFPKDLSDYNLYVTNYNKLIKKTLDGGYTLKDNIIEFLSKFELVIIDESHIILKDSFRCDVLIPFIESLQKAAESTKVILQTATPMEEEQLFDIKNKIVVHKEVSKDIKFIYRKIQKEVFNIQELNCLVTYYTKNSKKVYVYWNNASLRQLNEYKACYSNPDRVAIYHKRNSGEQSMEHINQYHELGDEYDVLLSSVYFGVGNDLNDSEDAAVIIVGNNSWQEDIQAIGRWRNSKCIEVCQVILPNENIEEETRTTFEEILTKEERKLRYLWADKNNKDKSVLISRKAYQIRKESDIRYLSVMKAASIYNSLLYIKQEKLQDTYYGIRIKGDLSKYIENNEDYTNKSREYWKEVKQIRNTVKQDIIAGKKDWNVINSDSNISKFNSLWNKIKQYGIDKIIPISTIISTSNYHKLDLFCKYYKQLVSRKLDFAELYSLIWYRNNYKEGITKIGDAEIDNKLYYATLAYIIFIRNKNVDTRNSILQSFYFNTFKWYCKLFYDLPQELINMFYSTRAESEIDMSKDIEFFGEDMWKDYKFEDTIIHNFNDIYKYFDTNHGYSQSKINEIMSMCLNIKVSLKSDAGKMGGKIGGKTGKKCVVIKDLPKYQLNIGMEFETRQALIDYVNDKTGIKLTNTTLTRWNNVNITSI